MRCVFLDAVGLIARWNANDQWHARSTDAFRQLQAVPCRLVTTPAVLLECGNAAARMSFPRNVVALRIELEMHGNLVHPTDADEQSAWEAYARGDAAQAGIVDHLSFAVMRRINISEAFTNDRHFTAAGFVSLF